MGRIGTSSSRGGNAAWSWGVFLGALAAGAAAAMATSACGRAPLALSFPARIEQVTASFAGLSEDVRAVADVYADDDGAAPALALTTPDGSGLTLRELEARAVVVGPLAITELHLGFDNPEERVLEGRFVLRLPPGATITRFAMEMDDGRWEEAEMTGVARARRAYESALHRRIDPAVGELTADGRFVARVFPIAPRATKRLVVAWVHERADAKAPYVLPLGGLPAAGKLSARVVDGAMIHERDEAAAKAGGDWRVTVGGADAVAAGPLVAVRAQVPAAADGVGGEALAGLTILFDTSASRAAGYAADVRRLDEAVRAIAKVHGGALPLRVYAFDQTIEPIYTGRADGFGAQAVRALRLRRALGASNLEGALATVAAAHPGGRLILWSDLAATAGRDGAAAWRAALAGAGFTRVDVVLADGGDALVARAFALAAGARPGATWPADAGADEVARRLGASVLVDVPVEVAGAEWSYPRVVTGVQAGDVFVVHARRKASAVVATPVTTTVGGKATESPVAEAPQALLERTVAGARLRELAAAGATPAALQAVSRREHVLSRHTALVILESDGEYAQFGIDRRAPRDVLMVGKRGLRLVPRRVVPAAVAKASDQPTPAGTSVLHGTVLDQASGEAVPGATVVLTPAFPRELAEITDERGAWRFVNLPAGSYEVTYYYADTKVAQLVTLGEAETKVLELRIDTDAAGGEVIEIRGKAPTVDPSSTNQGVVLGSDYTRNVPGGRTYEGAMGSSAGSQHDGRSFSGTTSSESVYIVDGINTTGGGGGGGGGGRAPAPGVASPPVPGPAAGGAAAATARGDDALPAALAAYLAAPGDPGPLLALGAALVERGQPALAARVYGSLADLHPTRAEMGRLAAAWLAPLGGGATELALDLAARAAADRPDQPHGQRVLAWVLVAQGRHAEAMGILEALVRRAPAGLAEVARQDLGLVAAAWAAREPARRAALEARVQQSGGKLETHATLRFVLVWETDASDLDLVVRDGEGHEASAQVPSLPEYGGSLVTDATDGYGPEAFVIDGPDVYPYTIEAQVKRRGATARPLGHLQILAHDGHGHLRVETRAFVAGPDEWRVLLGEVPAPAR